MLIVSLLGVFLYTTPLELIKDYLNLQNFKRIYDLHNQILNALVTILGLYISISLIAHEIFKQKTGVALDKSLLLSKVNILYIGFLTTSILFVFFCSLYITSKNLNHNETNIIYFNSYLFLITIILFVPISFKLFKSLRPEAYAEAEISKINSENIFIKKIDGDIKKQAELVEKNPFVKVKSTIINLIENKETIQSIVIINKVTTKVGELIINEENKKNQEYITKRLVAFYIDIIDYCIQLPNNSLFLNSVFDSIEVLYGLTITSKSKITDLEFFTEMFFKRYIGRLFENNREEVIFECLETFKRIIENQIKSSLPKHDDISHLYKYRELLEKDFIYPEFNSEIHLGNKIWEEISINLYEVFTMFIEKSITYNKPDILNDSFQKMNRLNSKIDYPEISQYKKMFFLIQSAVIISDYTYEAYVEGLFKKGSDAKNLNPILLDDLIIAEHPAARTILQKYCYLLIKLQKIDKIDFWFIGGINVGIGITEGELGYIVRRCIQNYNNKTVENCLEDCVDTYKVLKEFYEKNKPNDIRLYKQIKKCFETMCKLMEKESIKDKKILLKIKSTLETFKDLESENNF